MPYPDDLLSDGERVILHKHSHWKMLLVPYLVLIVTVGVGIWLAILVQDQSWKHGRLDRDRASSASPS